MRRAHDLGGMPAGPIDRSEPPPKQWEKRFGAIIGQLCGAPGTMLTLDEFRRGVEDLGAEDYRRLGWYERAAAAVANLLLERGVITVDELGRKLAEIDARTRRSASP